MTKIASYQPLFGPTFKKCLEKCPHLKERIQSFIRKILGDPYFASHLLKKKGKIDLRGKRSRHLSGNFVAVYLVCEECR